MGEIGSGQTPGEGRVRKLGGGRPTLTDTDATLLEDLKALVVGDARGDRESPPLWTAKSVRMLGGALGEQGHAVSHQTVAKLLRGLGYSLQSNRKMLEGASHRDRDAQFEHINATVAAAQAAAQPTISVEHQEEGADRRLQQRRP
jgi:transposase